MNRKACTMSLKKGLLVLKITVSVLLLVLLLRQIGGIGALTELLRSASWSWCIVGAVAAFVHLVLTGLNIWIMLLAVGVEIPFLVYINFFVYSYGLGLLLPGQTGDAVITMFLKRKGIPISTSGACYLVDKIITFALMVTVSAYGFHVLLPDASWQLMVIILSAVLSLGIIFIFSVQRIPVRSGFLLRIRDAIKSLGETILSLLQKKRFVVLNLAITILNWVVLTFCYYFVFLAFNQPVSWLMVGAIPIMASFVGYIPISLGGIGVIEFSAVYLFSLIGIPQAVVLGVYFIQRSIQYCMAGVLVLLFAIFESRLERRPYGAMGGEA